MLRDKRIEKGYSQEELAKESGVKLQSIQKYEQGKRNINGSNVETLAKISISLNCRIRDILTDNNVIKILEHAKL